MSRQSAPIDESFLLSTSTPLFAIDSPSPLPSQYGQLELIKTGLDLVLETRSFVSVVSFRSRRIVGDVHQVSRMDLVQGQRELLGDGKLGLEAEEYVLFREG
jgi:hypothetical protein